MRLTNDIRGAICSAVIDHAFKKEDAALLVIEHALADEAYALAVPPSLEKHLEAIATAYQKVTLAYDDKDPEHASPHRNYYPTPQATVGVSSPGIRHIELRLSAARLQPYYGADTKLGVAHPLTDRVTDFNRATEANGDLKNARAAEVMAVLNTAFNVAKLEIIWPEVMTIARPILANFGMKAPVQLPAVLMAPLNAALDLPVEELELEAA